MVKTLRLLIVFVAIVGICYSVYIYSSSDNTNLSAVLAGVSTLLVAISGYFEWKKKNKDKNKDKLYINQASGDNSKNIYSGRDTNIK
ncbi:TPA: hypothetical protein ACWLU8_001289 [Morganella morganii]